MKVNDIAENILKRFHARSTHPSCFELCENSSKLMFCIFFILNKVLWAEIYFDEKLFCTLTQEKFLAKAVRIGKFSICHS